MFNAEALYIGSRIKKSTSIKFLLESFCTITASSVSCNLKSTETRHNL